MRDCLIIVGMHRSGTSALAGAVHRMGVAVGSDIVAGQADNVPGYYEHRGVLELHEGLLAACGSSWDDVAPRDWRAVGAGPAIADFQRSLEELLLAEFGDTPLWLVKDPRLCYFLPLWLPVLDHLEVTPRVLFAHRPAAEVAASLARRNGFSADKSHLLWVDHLVSAEKVSRGCPRTFVGFADLIQNPIGVLERVARQLRLEWPLSPASRQEALGDFVDPSLRHTAIAHPAAEPTAQVRELVAPLEAALAAAAESPLDESAFDTVALRRRERGTPDALVVEHLHQFARREAVTAAWAVKQALSQELSGASTRLSEGLANIERSLCEIQGGRSELAEELGSLALLAEELVSRNQLAEDRGADFNRTLSHLSAVAANLERATHHQDTQLADLRARLDRLQHDVDVEARLEALRRDLEYVAAQAQLLAERRSWWQQALDRLAFWRSGEVQPDTSADS